VVDELQRRQPNVRTIQQKAPSCVVSTGDFCDPSHVVLVTTSQEKQERYELNKTQKKMKRGSMRESQKRWPKDAIFFGEGRTPHLWARKMQSAKKRKNRIPTLRRDFWGAGQNHVLRISAHWRARKMQSAKKRKNEITILRRTLCASGQIPSWLFSPPASEKHKKTRKKLNAQEHAQNDAIRKADKNTAHF